MVLDALRGYVELATGLTEVSRQRAVTEAKALLAQRGAFEQLLSEQAKGFADDVGRQVQTVADEILATSKANREVLLALVRAEAERAVGSLGVATADEIAALRRKVERLERDLRAASAAAGAPAQAAPTGTAAKRPATKKAAAPEPPKATKKAAAKRASAPTTAKKSTPKKGTQ